MITREDKLAWIGFITRTAMYIGDESKDDHYIVCFIHGYEEARKDCSFSIGMKNLLTNKYKISYTATGWPYQIERLSKKWSLSWNVTFKKLALEMLSQQTLYSGNFDADIGMILRENFVRCIEEIRENPHGLFPHEYFKNRWNSFCALKNLWFEVLFTPKELKIIEAINTEVQENRIIDKSKKIFPSKKLVKLKEQFKNAG